MNSLCNTVVGDIGRDMEAARAAGARGILVPTRQTLQEEIQQAAFSKLRAGARGGDVIAHAQSVLEASKIAEFTDFFAHGMGLITHEVPFLMTNHPVTYEGVDIDRPLEAGMVISVETTMLHPSRGFIKLEDTLAVTKDGYEMFGERGRGWNRGATAEEAGRPAGAATPA
jgi:methionine aminopeptidase